MCASEHNVRCCIGVAYMLHVCQHTQIFLYMFTCHEVFLACVQEMESIGISMLYALQYLHELLNPLPRENQSHGEEVLRCMP